MYLDIIVFVLYSNQHYDVPSGRLDIHHLAVQRNLVVTDNNQFDCL